MIPSEQLDCPSRAQGFQVEYKDFPKNKNEFVSLINCSSQPPLISHSIGKNVEFCHFMAALNILKLLSGGPTKYGGAKNRIWASVCVWEVLNLIWPWTVENSRNIY